MESNRFEWCGVVYLKRYRKCGKKNCSTCRDGQGHGPYWYRGLEYVGKRLPDEVLLQSAYFQKREEKLKAKIKELKEQQAKYKKLYRDITEMVDNLDTVLRGGYFDLAVLRLAGFNPPEQVKMDV